MERKIRKIKEEIKGITLVALVVTIIVLLILAGVAISLSIGEDGIFKRAGEGAETYKNASENEKIELDKVSNYIGDYLNGNNKEDEEEEEEIVLDVEEAIKSGTIYKENTTIYDKYSNPVKVPAGFKLAKDSGKDVTKGIVIEDANAGDEISKGNQYVWVPIGDVKYNENGDVKTINLGRYEFETNTAGVMKQSADDYETVVEIDVNQSYNYVEKVNNNNEETLAKDLEEFITKAKNSGGYYIGRYEVGDANAKEERIFTEDTSHPEAIPVIKKDKWPYNYINQADASKLAKNLYNENSDVESDLISSYAWDTAIIFIQTFSGDIDYSKQIYLQESLNTTGNEHDSNNNYDVRCNIYDMAGNVEEWTTEECTNVNSPCVDRGGRYGDKNDYVANRSYSNTNASRNVLGFRTIMYL